MLMHDGQVALTDTSRRVEWASLTCTPSLIGPGNSAKYGLNPKFAYYSLVMGRANPSDDVRTPG